MINIDKIDESKLAIHSTDRGILQNLSDHFSFYAKNYRHSPRYKSRAWDGKIRLMKLTDFGVLGGGLIHALIRYLNHHNYSFDLDPDIHIGSREFNSTKLFDSFNLDFKPHDYQVNCVNAIFTQRRILVLSPTSSGKSLIIYAVAHIPGRVLIIVPTASLVEQLTGDFSDYSINNKFNVDTQVHQIYGGRSKVSDKKVTISTWQSIYTQPSSWFNQFSVVIVDEAHGASAVSLTEIMDNCTQVPFRIGLTGTIEDGKCHKMQLVSLFGEMHKTITTHELIERKLASRINVKCFIFSENHSKMKYEDEINYIITHPILNNAICRLAMSRNGTTVVLYSRVDDHGVKLFEQMHGHGDRNIFIIHQKVSIKERMEIIRQCEGDPKAVIVASFATFSTGINLKSIAHVIFAHPFQSKIRILQSIGRALRLSTTNEATIYDIILMFNNYRNLTYKHFLSRKSQYENAKFPYEIKEIRLT